MSMKVKGYITTDALRRNGAIVLREGEMAAYGKLRVETIYRGVVVNVRYIPKTEWARTEADARKLVDEMKRKKAGALRRQADRIEARVVEVREYKVEPVKVA